MSDKPDNPGHYHWWMLLVLHESELLPVNFNSHVANTVQFATTCGQVIVFGVIVT
jgi:desulfoferrodoxin (superoxide reductase-like protein)